MGWNTSFSQIVFQGDRRFFNGEYQSMQEEVVTVTVTATVGGMLPVKEGGTLLAQSDFIVSLEAGDTLDLYAGHVTTKKRTRDAYGGDHMFIEGGNLEDVVFCVISDRF